MRIEPDHVQVSHLGFVIVARFEITVRFAKKTGLFDFLGAAGHDGGRQREGHDAEEDFGCLHLLDDIDLNVLHLPALWQCQVCP